MAKLQITLKKSPIGRMETQRKTLQALGLRKLNQTVLKDDTPSMRGQIEKVSHLITCEQVDG
jgi:large subunit ribosomal protein L30